MPRAVTHQLPQVVRLCREPRGGVNTCLESSSLSWLHCADTAFSWM